MTSKDCLPKKGNEEFITPHRLTFAILIHVFTQYRNSDNFRSSPLNCKYRRDFAVLSLKLLQKPDLSLEELRHLLLSEQYVIPLEVIETFDETLAAIYTNGAGYLLDSVDNLGRTIKAPNDISLSDLADTFITKNSVIGYFLRRLIIHFDNLTFSEVTDVYLAFQRYYNKWKNGSVANVRKEVFSDDWCSTQEFWSRRQAELFVATQAALLSSNEEKALNPVELQKRIHNLLKSNSELSEAHFLSYLNYARLKEFCGAIDSLYHCFAKGDFSEKTTSEEKTKGQRYAALNLAILHYHFGHNEEALASLKECIKISQEANDNVCLQQSLCWLYRLTNSNRDKLISQCTQLSLTYTASLGLQTMSKVCLEYSQKPITTFENLFKSDLINYQHNHKDLISNNYSMKAVLWAFYGKTEMSSMWSQLYLYMNIDNASFYAESFNLSVCSMAHNMIQEGEYYLAQTILQFAKHQYPNEPHCLKWMLTENLFVYQRAMLHENWSVAESAAQKIIVLNKYEGYLKLAELNYYKEDYVEANKCIHELFAMFKEEENIYYYVRTKILLAEIQFSSSHPHVVPAGIVTILEDCLIETNKYNLNLYTSIIHLHIANIQLVMGLSGQAFKLIERGLVQVLAHGGILQRAKALLLYVKCMVAESANLIDSERNLVLLDACNLLGDVKNDFHKLEAYSRVKDVLYLQSQLYNALGMNAERNKTAYDFKLLEQEYTTKNTFTLIKYL